MGSENSNHISLTKRGAQYPLTNITLILGLFDKKKVTFQTYSYYKWRFHAGFKSHRCPFLMYQKKSPKKKDERKHLVWRIPVDFGSASPPYLEYPLQKDGQPACTSNPNVLRKRDHLFCVAFFFATGIFGGCASF